MAMGSDRPSQVSGRRPGRGDGPGRAHRTALALVILGAVVLRLLHLDQPIRYDEAVTFLEYVSLPLSEAVSRYDLPNNHVFHTVLAGVAVDLLGSDPRVLRLPALLAGVAVVPILYRVGRALHGPDAGLLAAAGAAASPVLVLFSTNARGYSLVVLAFLVMLLAAHGISRRGEPAAWAAFVAAAALGAWAIPVMLYPAAAVAGWLLLETRGPGRRPVGQVARELAGAVLAAAALTALLYAPVLREGGLDALVGNRFVEPASPAEVWRGLPGFLGDVAAEWTRGVPAAVTALLGAGAMLEGAARLRSTLASAPVGPPPGGRAAGRGGGRRTGDDVTGSGTAVFPVALGAALVVLAATRRIPFARVWLFLLPALLLFGSAGLVRGWRAVRRAVSSGRVSATGGGMVPALGALLLLAGVAVPAHRSDAVTGWGLTGSLPRGDEVARFLAERWEPGDAVRASIPSDAPLEYYFRRLGLPVRALNGAVDPGGCRFRVVNRRHGETVPESAPGASPGAGDGGRVVLRSWPEVSILGEAVDWRRGAGPHPCRD
jgi:hypothetical protein